MTRWCGVVVASVLCVLGAMRADAQTMEGGVKVGIASAGMSIDDGASVPTKSRTGLVAGAFVRRVVEDNPLGIQVEALVTQKGVKFPGDDAEIKITYVEVPLLARYAVELSGGARPYVVAGPSLAIRMATAYVPKLDAELPELIARTDAGLVLGGGVDVGRLVLDARYTLGLKNVLSADWLYYVNETGSGKNRAFTVTVGYRFGE